MWSHPSNDYCLLVQQPLILTLCSNGLIPSPTEGNAKSSVGFRAVRISLVLLPQDGDLIMISSLLT